jgi:hypothetical protein
MLTRRRVTSHHPLRVINHRIVNLATTVLRSNNVGAINLEAVWYANTAASEPPFARRVRAPRSPRRTRGSQVGRPCRSRRLRRGGRSPTDRFAVAARRAGTTSSTAPRRPAPPKPGPPAGLVPAGAPGATRQRDPPTPRRSRRRRRAALALRGSLRATPVARPRSCSNSICVFFVGMTAHFSHACTDRPDTPRPTGGSVVSVAVRGRSACELVAVGQHQRE